MPRKPGNNSDLQTFAGVVLIRELGRIVRWSIVAVAACIIGWKALDVTQQVLMDDTDWTDVAKVALILLAGALATQSPYVVIVVWVKTQIRKLASRNSHLESIVDDTRSSSSLSKEGVHELDA